MKKILFFILIFSLFINYNTTQAGSLYFESAENFKVNDVFRVRVFLDADEEYINSLDLKIKFQQDLLEFMYFDDNKTLLKTWLEKPSLVDNSIQMSAIIPGGINGLYDISKNSIQDIPLVDLIFKAKNTGTTSLGINEIRVLKNDGLGEELGVDILDFSFNIQNDLEGEDEKYIQYVISPEEDENPPLPFEISFLEKDDFLDNKNVLIFNATDLESGIKEYKIKKGSNWININSPHVVGDYIFNKKIHIRAYDFNNNFRESYIIVKGSLDYRYLLIFLLILAGILYKKLVK